ncbi:YadA-like family protein [Suttonella sp. R2A3]|uniref:YadA-like family protein n=1 Tax=Suttonella sp. R2A3 TaxID=2908648 RepID=UPI001F469440|nr:YadA-like family protein [Suttonella sp. R2A3]UJF25084.1 YadA-like family protein [Suttonella sp. R2A3]
MNKIYRVVWNASLNALVVASELAKSHSRGSTVDTTRHDFVSRTPASISGFTLKLLSASILLALGIGQAQAEVFINDNIDNECLVSDTTGVHTKTRDNCNSTNPGNEADIQTDRVLFWDGASPASDSTATHASFGGDVFLNQSVHVKNGAIVDMGGNRVTNVSAAIANTDAVNLQQLKTAQTHFYSVNSSDSTAGNYNNEGATGTNALAAGVGSIATQENSIAIGGSSSAKNAIAVGNASTAQGEKSVAIGQSANSTGLNAVSLGANSASQSDYSIAIGDIAVAGSAGKLNSIAIGKLTFSLEQNAVAIGHSANANVEDSVALGANSNANTAAGVVGYYGLSTPSDIATSTWTSTRAAVSIGNAGAGVTRQITGLAAGTVDTDAVNVAQLKASEIHFYSVNNTDSTAGNYSNDGATGSNALAAGVGTQASGNSSVAIGDGAQATGLQSISIGTGNIVSGAKSGAIGGPNTVSGTGSYALGNNNTIAADNAFVLGNNVNIDKGKDSAVVLGDASATSDYVQTQSTTINGTTYGTFAGSDALSAGSIVSVGKAGAERQIKNVAAGQISATSTDAINGSQLYYVANSLDTAVSKPLTFAGDSGTNVARKLGSTVNIKGGATTVTDNNIGVVANGKDTLSVKLAQNVDLGTDGSLKTGVTTVNSKGVTVSGGPSVTKTGIDAANNKIINVAPGLIAPSSNDAINGSQLYSVKSELSSAGLKFVGNNDDVVHRSLGSPLKLIGAEKTDTTTTLANSTDAPTKGVYTAKNIQVFSDQPNKRLQIQMADNPEFDSVKVTYITASKGFEVTGGPSVTKTGIDAGGKQITNLASAGDITKSENANNAVNAGDVNKAIAGVQNSPLTFSGDSGTNIDRKLGETLKLNGGITDTTALTGKNIGVVTDSATNTLNIRLAKEITGVKSIFLTGGTHNQVVLSNNGLDNGNNVITNVAKGTNDSDAVNVAQLNEVKDKPLTFAGDNSTDVGMTSETNTIKRKLGEAITIKGGLTDASKTSSDSNIRTKVNAADNSISIEIADAPTFTGGVTAGNTNQIQLNTDDTGTITGLKNTDLSATDFATKGRAATEEQLKLLNTTASKGWNLSANGDTATNVAPGGKVTVNGSDNITVTRDATDSNKLTIATKNVVAYDADNNNTVTLKGTTYNATAGTGGTTITNVAKGINDSDAVNVAQLNEVKDKPLTFTGNTNSGTGVDSGSDQILGSKFKIVGGLIDTSKTSSNSNIRTVVTDGKVDIQLADAPIFTGTVTSATGFQVTGGPSVTKTGIDAGNKQITNLASAGDLGDSANANNAVNVSDLNAATSAVANNPLTFSGDTGGNVDRKLGETLKLNGGITDTTALTDKNIGVVANGTDTLSIKLAKDVDLGTDGGLTTGGTIINNSGLTTQGTVAIKNTSGDTVAQLDNTEINLAGTKYTSVNQAINKLGTGFTLTTTQSGGSVTGSSDEAIQAGDTITVDAGKNIALTQAAGKITVATKDDVAFTKITLGDATNNTVLTSTDKGLDVGGDKITNVAAGTTDNDAVNYSQLKTVQETANKGWYLSVKGGSTSKVAPGSTVDFSPASDNLTIIRKGNNLQFDLGNVIKVGAANTVTIDGNKGTIGGLTNTTFDPNKITSGQAATEDQLKAVADAASTAATKAKTTVSAGSNNITVKGDTTTNGDGSTNYTVDMAKDIEVDSVKVGGKVAINKEGIDAGGTKITQVGKGDISKDSTDAVNGGQIWELQEKINNSTGTPNKPLNFVGDDDKSIERKLGQTVSIKGGADPKKLTDNNIGVVNEGDALVVRMAKNVNLGEDGSVQTGDTTVNNDGITIVGGPSVTKSGGINAGGQRISNVAAGVKPTDAVNVAQFDRALNAVGTNMQRLETRVNSVERDANAGTAQALAAAGMPQAYLPGKSMVAVGGGTYNGESGYTVGLSTISDNGNWIIKANVGGDSRGNIGASLGAGYQW